jgi:AraC family ethanolamine operon transcriptional activator
MELDALEPPAFEWTGVNLPKAEFEIALRRVAPEANSAFAEVRATGRLPVGETAASTLGRLYRDIVDSLTNSPEALASEQARRSIRESLFVASIQAMQRSIELHRGPSAPPPSAERRRVFKLAEEYMRAHGHDPIRISDLCGVTGASERTLHYSFRDMIGVRPIEYLRMRRLTAVRMDLRAADPSATTVGEIAFRWGFWHLSRFASAYQRLFGELPSQTLRSRRQPSITVE